MNWDRIEGSWTQMVGKLREKYGELSDNELQETKGEKEQVLGLIQKKYGKTKDEAEAELDSFLAKV